MSSLPLDPSLYGFLPDDSASTSGGVQCLNAALFRDERLLGLTTLRTSLEFGIIKPLLISISNDVRKNLLSEKYEGRYGILYLTQLGRIRSGWRANYLMLHGSPSTSSVFRLKLVGSWPVSGFLIVQEGPWSGPAMSRGRWKSSNGYALLT